MWCIIFLNRLVTFPGTIFGKECPSLWKSIEHVLSWPSQFPFTAKDFIGCLMEKDPEKRFTCDQALQHPWWETNHTAPQLGNHREPHMLVRLNSSMTQIARLTRLSCRAFPPTVICRHGSKPRNPPLLGTASPQREICWINGCQLVAGVLKDPLRMWKL